MEPSNPQPTPPVVPPQPTGPVQSAKKMKPGVLWGIIIAAVLLLAGIAWGVYAMFFAATPESMLKEAVKNLNQEKTLAVDFGIAGEGATVNGSVAVTSDDSGKNGEAIITFGEGDQSIGISVLLVDEAMFFKLANIEQMAPLIALYSGNTEAFSSQSFIEGLKNLNGTWFKVDKQDLEALASGDETTTTTMSPEDVKRLLEIYENYTFIKTDKVFVDETINGKPSVHFSTKVDKQQFEAFLQEVKSANLASFNLTDKDITSLKEAVGSDKTTLELWIARDTHKFTKAKVVSEIEGSQVTITLTASATLPTFDKLEAPADAKPISELFGLMFGQTLPTDEELGQDLGL